VETKILNYKIAIEREKKVYVAYCPALGLSDYGKTIDESLKRMKALIKFHVESLSALGHPVPVEKDATALITSVEVPLPSSVKISYV
jgi:predicted RNase H-like HicB family nuclease